MLGACRPRTAKAAVAIAAFVFVVVNIVFFRSLMWRDQTKELKTRIREQAQHIEMLEAQIEKLKLTRPTPPRPRSFSQRQSEDPKFETMLQDARAALTVCNDLNDELVVRLRKAAEAKDNGLTDLLGGWEKVDNIDASPIGCRAELQTLRLTMRTYVPREEVAAMTASLSSEREQKQAAKHHLQECADSYQAAESACEAKHGGSHEEKSPPLPKAERFVRLAKGITDAPTVVPVQPTRRPVGGRHRPKIDAKRKASLLRPSWLSEKQWQTLGEEPKEDTDPPTREPTSALTPPPTIRVQVGGSGISERMQKYGSSTAVLMICYNRAQYLQKALDKVIATRPHDDLFPIFVSQDGEIEDVTDVIEQYRSKVKHFKHDNSVPVQTTRPKENPSYFKISRHYGWAIDKVFEMKHIERVIILEEDLEVSADFFHYMAGGAWLLDEDPSIWCVSAWNDNGKSEFVKDADTLYRSDFFPGLGWMMKRELWSEIGGRWPRENGYWDDWMRRPDVRRGRACIRPEVSRTYTFGRKGASGGQFFDKFLSKIVLNEKVTKFDEMDLSHLTKVVYDTNFRKAVFFAQRVNEVYELRNEGHDARELRYAYGTMKDFAKIAKSIGIMTDEKAGVPRTGYQGVVTFWYGANKLNHVFLVPETFG